MGSLLKLTMYFGHFFLWGIDDIVYAAKIETTELSILIELKAFNLSFYIYW